MPETNLAETIKKLVLQWLKTDSNYRHAVMEIVKEEAERAERRGGPKSPFR